CSASQGRVQGIALPEDARLSITIKNRSGTDVFTNHEMQVLKTGDGYTTEPLELVPGSYVISDLVIVDDTEVVNATPKKESTFSAFVTHSLPYDFSVVEGSVANVSLEVIATRNERPEAFGYASFRIKRANVLSFIVSKPKGGQSSLQEA